MNFLRSMAELHRWAMANNLQGDDKAVLGITIEFASVEDYHLVCYALTQDLHCVATDIDWLKGDPFRDGFWFNGISVKLKMPERSQFPIVTHGPIRLKPGA